MLACEAFSVRMIVISNRDLKTKQTKTVSLTQLLACEAFSVRIIVMIVISNGVFYLKKISTANCNVHCCALNSLAVYVSEIYLVKMERERERKHWGDGVRGCGRCGGQSH